MKKNKFVAEGDQWDIKGRYVHREPDGTFCSYIDGNHQGGDRPTYRKAAEDMFPGVGAGGYELLYYPKEDGYLCYCAECALEDWLQDPKVEFHVENSDCDAKFESDMTCDICEKVIVPQQCPDCGDPLDLGPMHIFITRLERDWTQMAHVGNRAEDPHVAHEFYRNQYGVTYHGACIAAMVVKGEAKKVGKQAYEIKWGGTITVKGPRAIEDETNDYLNRLAENASADYVGSLPEGYPHQ